MSERESLLAALDRYTTSDVADFFKGGEEWYEAADVETLVRVLEERLGMRDEALSRWFAHYPDTIFPDVPLDQLSAAVAAIQGTGITSDRLYGAWARHLLFHVMLEIKQADDEMLLRTTLYRLT